MIDSQRGGAEKKSGIASAMPEGRSHSPSSELAMAGLSSAPAIPCYAANCACKASHDCSHCRQASAQTRQCSIP